MFYRNSKFNCVSKTNQTSNHNSPRRFFRERCQEYIAMLTRHFQTRIQPAFFKLKRTMVPVDQFVNFEHIFVKRKSIFHKPCVSFLKSVYIFRNLFLKTASIQKRPIFPYSQVPKNSPSTCSIFFILVFELIVFQSRKVSLTNATGLILALSCLILGFSKRVFALR